jgi:hypothetical protein
MMKEFKVFSPLGAGKSYFSADFQPHAVAY